MAFAMTQLAWGGLESRAGYEHAGEMGTLLKTIRWGTDYFMKAHVDDEVLFGMVRKATVELIVGVFEANTKH